jgi:membrane protein YqaA with SNARE-associated domain
VLTLASFGAFHLAGLLPTSPLFLTLGYVGVFLLTMTCSATLFLPVPSWGAITVAGGFLNPFLLGVVAGAGAATGELTGYLAGQGGRLAFGADARGPLGRVRALVGRHGFVTLLLLSAVPNPLFDVAGLAAGSLGFSPVRYWIAVTLGKSVDYTVLALAGQSLLPYVP